MADDQTEIKNPTHAELCITNLQSLWESGDLCDMTLEVAGSQFKVHKFLLVSHSKYFKNMLLNGRYVEANENLVELEEIDPQFFQKILRYFYYGSIVVSMKDIEEVIKLADYFLVDTLKMYCTDYVQKLINKQNCVWGFLLADRYKLKEEYRCQALDFISTNIEEISKTDDFCKLSHDKLVEILNYNASNGCSENLFNALFQWIAYDKDNRHDSILDLVTIISTRGLKQSFLLENLLTEPLIRENPDCSNWLFDQIHQRFATKINFCNEKCNALFVTSAVQNISYSLNVTSKELTLLSARPKDIRGFCVCSHKDNVFLLGGEYERKAYDKSMKINSGKQEWEELNWDFGRRDVGACVLSNEIYIVGGYNIEQQTASNSFHVCDLETGKQIRLRDMIRKRQHPALCTHGGSLYACCGNDGATSLDTIERYDPREGHWEIYATLPRLSGSCSTAIREDKLFICKTAMDGNSHGICRLQLLDFKNKCSNDCSKIKDWYPVWNCTLNDKIFYVDKSNVVYDMLNWNSHQTHFSMMPNFDCPIIVPWKKVYDFAFVIPKTFRFENK